MNKAREGERTEEPRREVKTLGDARTNNSWDSNYVEEFGEFCNLRSHPNVATEYHHLILK